MFSRVSFFAAFVILFCHSSCFALETASSKMTVGWVENVTIDSVNTTVKAKMDTGAKTSSMRADVIKTVKGKEKNSSRVVFQITDKDGQVKTLERHLVRWVRIKDKEGGMQRRPVVAMNFCIGGRSINAEVNLAPRLDFLYPVLIGRNMLRNGGMIVDPSQTFATQPVCPKSDEADNNE